MALFGQYNYYELAGKVCSAVLEINIIIISLCGKGYELKLIVILLYRNILKSKWIHKKFSFQDMRVAPSPPPMSWFVRN